VGRPVKAGKENVAGFVAALEEYVAEDEAAHLAYLGSIRDFWIDGLSDIPSIETGIFVPTQPGMHPVCIPKAFVRARSTEGFGPARKTADMVRTTLRGMRPSIIVDLWKDCIVLNPQTIREQEAKTVLSSIRNAILN
jgi:seryl-tRNA(Sec) selenium transferase